MITEIQKELDDYSKNECDADGTDDLHFCAKDNCVIWRLNQIIKKKGGK